MLSKLLCVTIVVTGLAVAAARATVVEVNGGTSLAGLDGDQTPLYKLTNTGPGSNAFDGSNSLPLTPSAPVPEPSTLGLVGLGVAALSTLALRRRVSAKR